MSRSVVTVRGGAPISACAMRLAEHQLRHLPIVDERGALAGLVDDATVFQRGAWLVGEGWVPYELDGPEGVARDLAAPAGRIVGPNEPLPKVLEALRDGTDCVVVVDPAFRPIGLFTDHDAVVLAARTLPPAHLARDAGTPPVVTVHLDDLAMEAYDALFAFDVRHAVVIGGSDLVRAPGTRDPRELQDRTVVAVISWRDLVAHDVARRPHLRVSAVIPSARTRDPGRASDPPRVAAPFTIAESESVAEAARRMAEHHIGCLPVVDEGRRLLRVIERADVIGLLLDHLSR